MLYFYQKLCRFRQRRKLLLLIQSHIYADNTSEVIKILSLKKDFLSGKIIRRVLKWSKYNSRILKEISFCIQKEKYLKKKKQRVYSEKNTRFLFHSLLDKDSYFTEPRVLQTLFLIKKEKKLLPRLYYRSSLEDKETVDLKYNTIWRGIIRLKTNETKN